MLHESLETAESKDLRELAKTPESGFNPESGRDTLDRILDLSEMRLEYQKPQIHHVSFGSSCTS